MKRFILEPKNGRKSFGNKCMVEVEKVDKKTRSRLISYTMEVATYDHEDNVMKVKGYYSPTTMAHINAFLDHYGFDMATKKELTEKYL